MSIRLLIVGFFSLMIVSTSPSHAQDSAQDSLEQNKRSEAIAKLKSQSLIRTHTTELGLTEGQFLKYTGDSLFLVSYLEQKSVSVPAIDALWVRGRATKTGAIVGGAIGAVGGGLLGIFAVAIGSLESGDDPNYVFGAIGGGILAGGICGLLGAGIGAAIPKWHFRYRSPTFKKESKAEKESLSLIKPTKNHKIGTITLLGGYARDTWKSAPKGSLGGRLNYAARIRPAFEIGPEFGYYRLGSGSSLWHVCAAARLSKTKKTKRYYGITDLGLYDCQGSDHAHLYIGFGLGGGISFHSENKPFAVTLEGRWHSNLSRVGYDSPFSFLTFMGGIQYSW